MKSSKTSRKKDNSQPGQATSVEYIHVERNMEKEAKEMKKVMEKVAKAVIKQEVQTEISRIESFFTVKMAQLEERIHYTNTKNEENFRLLDQRILNLHGEIDKISDSLMSNIEKERQKRLEMIKKMHKKHKNDFASMKEDSNKNKENINDLKSKRDEKTDKFEDTGNIVERLNKRVNRLEATVRENLDGDAPVKNDGDDSDCDSIDDYNISDEVIISSNRQSGKTKKHINASSKASKSKPKGGGRIATIEATLSNLRLSQGGLEENLELLKSKVSLLSLSSNKVMVNNDHGEAKEELKQLKKRLRELGESTAKACKSLGGGIFDLQQTSLSFFGWADQAHAAVGVVAEKVGFRNNPCPPIPLQNHLFLDQKLKE